MKILILGSKGQLGTALTSLLEDNNADFNGIDLPEFDITNEQNTIEVIEQFKPGIIINTCAYTDVKAAEYEFLQATLVNGICLKKLVEICNNKQLYFCHISTDYVFNGQKGKPYIEEDSTDPINIYGLSKEFGERIVKHYSNNYVIVRTAALYGKSTKQSENVVDKVIHYATMNKQVSLVDDEYTSPTYAKDLAHQIYVILEKSVKGIIHATTEGECNWYEFGKLIFQTLDMDVNIKKVRSQDFSSSLKKPLYSVLENARLKSLNINVMPHWTVSLQKYLESNYNTQ